MSWNDENASNIVIIRPSGGSTPTPDPSGGGSGGGSGVDDYRLLSHLPSIEGVELNGDKTFEALNLQPIGNSFIDGLFS